MSFKRIHSKIAHDIGVAILGGVYAPGDTLAGEIAFSGKLKVSRAAFREAIRILSAKGLVESKPRTGTRITQRQMWNILDPDVLGWMFEAGPTEEFIRELFELRMIVEPDAAALAATRRTSRELARLGHALEEMERHGLDSVQGQKADEEFHGIVVEAARNEPLMQLSKLVGAAVRWTTMVKNRDGAPRDAVPDHRSLFDAIVEGSEKKARAATVELLKEAFEETKLWLEHRQSEGMSARRIA